MLDHVHLLVEVDPQRGIHRLIKQMKGRSSHVLRRGWHECQCGIGPVQRDLYSAYLARHVTDDGLTIDMRQAVNAWPGAQPLLERAMARVEHQAANGGFTSDSFGLRRQSCSPVKDGSTLTEAVDAVGEDKTSPESRGVV